MAGWFSPMVCIFCLSWTPRWMCFFWGGLLGFCRGLVKNQVSNTVRCLYFFCHCRDRWRWLNPIQSFVYFWVTRIWVTRRRAKWGPISAYGGKGWRLERWRSLSVDEVAKTIEQKQLNKSLNDILNLPSPPSSENIFHTRLPPVFQGGVESAKAAGRIDAELCPSGRINVNATGSELSWKPQLNHYLISSQEVLVLFKHPRDFTSLTVDTIGSSALPEKRNVHWRKCELPPSTHSKLHFSGCA